MIYLVLIILAFTILNILIFLRKKEQSEQPQTIEVQSYFSDIAPLLDIYEIQALAAENETCLCFWAKDKRNGKQMKLCILKKIYQKDHAVVNEFFDEAYEKRVTK
jgi:hypothetical protein